MRKFTKRRRADVGRVIVGVIGVAGVISIAVLAPNALQALTLFQKKKSSYDRRYYFNRALANLKRRGLVRFEKKKGKTFVRLTRAGRDEFHKYRIGEYKINKPARWDGKYRVVIFDIKEYRKGTRNFLRGQLAQAGFLRLQNSVWVYPYECEEFVKLLKAYCRLGRDVLYMTVASIESDRWIRQEFEI